MDAYQGAGRLTKTNFAVLVPHLEGVTPAPWKPSGGEVEPGPKHTGACFSQAKRVKSEHRPPDGVGFRHFRVNAKGAESDFHGSLLREGRIGSESELT